LENLKNIAEDDKKDNKKDEDKLTIKELLKSYYFTLSAYLSNTNNLITKMVIFTILMKYFRKIRLMKFIIRIINYIFLTTFSIFLTDIYGLKEIFTQIEYYCMEYVNFIHENKIYKTLIKIFNVITDGNKSEIIEDKSEVIDDKFKVVENNSKSKIVNSEIPSSGTELKNEKIVHDKISGGNEKEN
jgi:hypothetical protein